MTATATRPAQRSDRRVRPVVAVAGCALVALASLPLPAALTFDAHAWLVWGREVGRLSLDTTGGPSWKPLPVLVTTVVAPLGTTAGAAAWMLVARTATLLALTGTYRLAARVAGRGAGVVAAVVLVLAPDGDPRFLRMLGEGHVAATTAACAVWAVDAHLDGRHRTTLVLAFVACLVRPEAWPFLLLHVAWLWRHHPDQRRLAAGLLVAVPALWFGPDWWGAGSPLEGAATAQVAAGDAVSVRLADAVGVLVAVVAPVALLAATAGLRSARRSGDTWLLVAAAGAAGWAALVVGMAAALGYAALSRFFLPVAAVLAVFAGVGAARAWGRLRASGRPLVGVALVAVLVAGSVPRVAALPSLLDGVAERAPVEADLDHVLSEVGSDRLLACGDLAVESTGLLRMAVAWKLDVPLAVADGGLDDAVDADGSPHGVALVRTGGRRDLAISRQDHTVPVLRSAEWSVLAVGCPAAVGSDT